MSTRHIAVKATLDRGYASEWNDDHLADFYARIEIIEDMVQQAQATSWNLAQETSTTATATTISAGVVAMRLNATGGVGNFASARHMLAGAAGNITNRTELPIFNAAVELGGLTADALTHEFGLFTNATAPFTANSNGAYFRVSSGFLYAVTGTGAAETATNIGAATQYGSYRIEVLSASVKFYGDDTATHLATNTTNLPAADVTMKFSTAQRAGGSNLMNVQACALSVLRDA
jgi:hypothetical protein